MKRGRNLRLLSISILLLALVALAAINVGVFTSKPPLEGESTSASDGGGAAERRQHITNRSSEIIHSKSVSIIARDDTSIASSQQGIHEGTSKFPAEEEETGQSKGRDAANSATEKKPKGPILFDHSNGWNGSTYEEGFIFCRNIAGSSQNLCPWATYCPKSQLLGGLEIDVNISKKELWAPLESQGQPAWVSLGAINPCMQRGSLDKREKTNIPFIMCCNEGEENVIDVNTRAEIENQTDLFLNDWACRNECHLPNSTEGSIADISTPQRYCIARCRSVRRKHALSRVVDFIKTRLQRSEDLLNDKTKCIEKCNGLGHDIENSVVPPLHQRYCVAGCSLSVSVHHPHFEARCGFIVAGYGDPNGKNVLTAAWTARRLLAMRPKPGWCPINSTLDRFPVTFYTDVNASELSGLPGGVIVHPDSVFDPLPFGNGAVSQSGFSNRETLGLLKYRWYHVQVMVHTPYEMALYLDADATVCKAERINHLFASLEKRGHMGNNTSSKEGMYRGYDVIFKTSSWHGGYGMTSGNHLNPHPIEAQTDEDFASWSDLKEANAGAIFFHNGRNSTRKLWRDWALYLAECFLPGGPNVQGDQYALREALWLNREDVRVLRFEEPSLNDTHVIPRICRGGEDGGCSNGCAVVHGWNYFSDVDSSGGGSVS